MPVDYTVTGLLASVRRRGMLPDSSGSALADADLLAFANDELYSYVVPMLVDVAEEYLVAVKDIAIVSGTDAYDIPERAIGNKVRDVQVNDGTSWRSLERIEPEQAIDYEYTLNQQTAFYLQGHQIVLTPPGTNASTLRVKYYRRPNALTATRFSKITSYSAGTPSVTVADGSVVDYEGDGTGFFDIISNRPPFKSRQDDVQAVSRATNVITLSAALSESPETNDGTYSDYLCAVGESPFPQIPLELHTLLVQRTVVRALEALGDPKAENARRVCDDVQARCLAQIAPRAEGTGRTIVNYNAPGWGRGTSRRRV